MKKLFLLLTVSIFYINLSSQVNQIDNTFMYGGKIDAYAKNTNCILVTTDGGIFKTINEGFTWTNATQNFDPYSVSCEKIVAIGSDFYAMNYSNYSKNIYKSSDDGANWSPLSFSNWWAQSLGKLGENLYVIGIDNFNGDGRLYSSPDGVSWTPKAIIWTDWQGGGNTELFFSSPNKLYIINSDNLYYTTDGNVLNPVSSNGLGSSNMFNGDNNFEGDGSGNLYYMGNGLLYKYNFTTETWIDILTGKIPEESFLMDFSATDNAIFLTVMSPMLGIIPYRSTDQGITFTELNETGLVVPMINNVIEVSANGFIGNWLDNKILVSSNGGSSWNSHDDQFIASSAANLIKSGNSLLFSRDVNGIILSDDEGLSWETANNGIPGYSDIAYFVSEITQVKDTIFAFLQADPFADEISLYKSSDMGNSWAASPVPSPFNEGDDYSFAGICGQRLFVNYFDPVSEKYALINTANNGVSWGKLSSQNTEWKTYLKGPQTCLFAFYSNGEWQDFDNVYRANSYGLSFSNLNPGIFHSSLLIKRVQDTNWDKGGPMMDFDEAGNKAVFAVSDRTGNQVIDKLYLYNITAELWSEINTTGLPSNYLANYIKYIGNNTWLIATNEGLYKSINGGIDWTITHNLNEWQKGILVTSIQNNDNKAFLGTSSNGVWVVDLSVTSAIQKRVSDNLLQIYPNPVTDIVNLIIPGSDIRNANVSLYSSDGREIMKKTVNTQQFQMDLHNLPSGSYFVTINANNNVYRQLLIRK